MTRVLFSSEQKSQIKDLLKDEERLDRIQNEHLDVHIVWSEENKRWYINSIPYFWLSRNEETKCVILRPTKTKHRSRETSLTTLHLEIRLSGMFPYGIRPDGSLRT